MENIIYRWKKQTRMVYPEKLTPIKRPFSSSSWCSGGDPLEKIYTSGARNRSGINDERPSSRTRQFIRERIRYLVQAFSHRTNTIKKRLDLPPTPSSISSADEIEPLPFPATSIPQATVQEPSTAPKSQELIGRVLDPQGKFYMCWSFILALVYLCNCWMISLRSTFPYQNQSNRVYWMCFDYLCDFVYVVDIVWVQPRIMFVVDGFWVTDRVQTKARYFNSSFFKKDLLSLLPLDLLYLYFGPEMVILRLPRMLKLHSFLNFFTQVDRVISSPHLVRISRTLLYMMYLIHLNACAYYAFSTWEGLGSNEFVFNGRGNAYIICFYFATKTATSIGKNPKPRNEIELLFMTFSWLMGVFVFALLISQIRDIIATATRSQSDYKKLVDETMEYLRRLNMPVDLTRRVQMWFTFTWRTQHTLDENSILDCLPHKMKTDIAINVHIQTLGKVKLFADCDEALLRELVLKLRSIIYLPGDMICHKGDVGHEMYILKSGEVQVLGATDTEVLATLTEGSVFGEISLLGNSGMNRRTANVRSKGYSNLFVLNKTDLNEALIHYPDAQEILNKKAKALMRLNASLERARVKPVIVIDNPQQTPLLLETVMQIVPPNSKTNKLLKYGSKGRPKTAESLRELITNSISQQNGANKTIAEQHEENIAETSFQCDVIVHRENSS